MVGSPSDALGSGEATDSSLKRAPQIAVANIAVADYLIAYTSRQASLLGRREVLSGRAKFGIFGDGKEVPQLAMAHTWQHGDWRSGYYRDQTLMLALGTITLQQFFAQLYAHPDVSAEPQAAGRQMNAHYATRLLDEHGNWQNQTQQYNTSADISPTASQMPRLVGLGYASVLYRELDELKHLTNFSNGGNEVAFGTIGNASCAEGMFWEAVNAIGVLESPVVLSIWDDEYGISVPNEYQHTKSDLGAMLSGFQRDAAKEERGFDIYQVRGWDYAALVNVYARAVANAREHHIPAIVHVVELTQPQGHSTSGSHERYKSKERLQWEADHDCLPHLRTLILEQKLIDESELKKEEEKIVDAVYAAKDAAWKACHDPTKQAAAEVGALISQLADQSTKNKIDLQAIVKRLGKQRRPDRNNNIKAIREALLLTRHEQLAGKAAVIAWRDKQMPIYQSMFGTHLYSDSAESLKHIPSNPPTYDEPRPIVSGFQVLAACFEAMLERDPRLIAFGEDLGNIGGVNQAFAGLQKRFGKLRVSDTGIRETTIMGQAIGMALRGLRPIAEVQYLDYLLYCLQLMADDLATIHWRTAGGQKAPVIVRTRGHRLEGIWHSGSPMAGIINLVHGINVLVPRDMVRAAGFYNTLLLGDEPGMVIEVLNGYRLKEEMPNNIAEITIPVGVPEVLQAGNDLTIVTYGSSCQIATEAAKLLAQVNISAEVIDVQSLLPFDINHAIVKSLEKTSRIIFLDEDVPGGCTAYMLQQVLEVQGGYQHLDADPVTISAKPHRPAYGADGAYFSIPNIEDVFEAAYEMMNETDPAAYPFFYK